MQISRIRLLSVAVAIAAAVTVVSVGAASPTANTGAGERSWWPNDAPRRGRMRGREGKDPSI